MAATTIARVSITDDDGTGTTGTIWNNAQLVAIYDDIDDLFKRTTAGDLVLELENTDVTATSDTGFIARVGSGAAGDAYFQATNGTVTYTWGLDNSASDAFAFAAGTTLGTNVFSVSSAGVMTVTGQIVLSGGFQSAVTCYINDTANAKMTLGLTINQGANDDEIVALKSSDIAHGITDEVETDSYMTMQKAVAASGGLRMRGISSGGVGFIMEGWATSDDTTKSTAGTGYIRMNAAKKSAATVGGTGANSNLFIVSDQSAGTRFILDSDGDSHQDVGTAWTNFDAHDDLALLHALSAGVSRRGDPLKRAFGRFLVKHRRTLERLKVVTFNKDQHHFINWSRTHMLTIGAVRQIGMELAKAHQSIATMQRQLAQLRA